ncbi:MAG: electron transfer flavoprotein subunit alpha/FixB family protein [Halobacteriaceae archaeon]
MPAVDPSEHTIQELGPAIKDIEDVAELEAILEAEKEGENRAGAISLIESRIEKFTGDEGSADGVPDVTSMSPADVGNTVRDIDDVAKLEAMLDAEAAAEDRDAVRTLIENRLDSVQGSAEGDNADGPEEPQTPEERHPNLDHPTADKRHVRALEDGAYRDMWVYCETQAGDLVDVSLEMLGKARQLMDEYNEAYDADERVVAVLLGDAVAGHAETCIDHGADVVLYQEDERLERFRPQPYTEVVCDMMRGAGHPYGRDDRESDDWRDYDEPRYVLFPATNNGRDLSALVQAELDSGLASDCSGLYIDEAMISNPAKTGEPGTKKEFERVLHMKRPDFSGFEYSTILCLDAPNREFHPQGASVIPGSFEVPDPMPEREGEVVEHDCPLDDAWLELEVTEYDRLEGGIDLTGHDVVVALGRGIGDDPTEGLELGLELVDAFDDAALGLSRGVITSSYSFDSHVESYVGEERQIGESGQEVAPPVYIAAGISGAVQHKVGMDESETIIAINTDDHADIRDFSDYYIQGDLFEVLPELTAAVASGDLDLEAVADGGQAHGNGGVGDD